MRSALRRAARMAAGVGALATVLLTTPTAAQAAGDPTLVLTPSTISAGYSVGITGSCGGVTAATVTSDAFVSDVPLVVQPGGTLVGTAQVKPNIKARNYNVRLTCAGGKTALASLWVLNWVNPTRGPNTGGGYLANQSGPTVMIGAGVVTIAAGVGLAIVARRRHLAG